MKITKFDDYQKKIIKTDTFRHTSNVLHPAMLEKIMGLTGEAGEVSDKFKKIIRDKNAVISKEDREEIIKELGDTLWYIASIARYLDAPLSEVAEKNVEKLYSRLKRGTLAGDGDNR